MPIDLFLVLVKPDKWVSNQLKSHQYSLLGEIGLSPHDSVLVTRK